MYRRKDYQRKIFRNPLFPRRNSSATSMRRRIFFGLIIAVLLLVGLVLVDRTDRYKIRLVDVRGIEQINQSAILNLAEVQLQKRRWLFFHQDTIFFFNKSSLKKTLLRQYQLEKVKINKDYFNTLVITVTEKPIAVVWLSENKKYYVDFSGIATAAVGERSDVVVQNSGDGTEIIRADEQAATYPTVYDQSNRPVEINHEVASPATVVFLNALHQAIVPRADFTVSHYTIVSPASEEITMQTKEGWQAYFTAADSPTVQAEKLFLILHSQVENYSNLEYIDLRFGQKVFYK